MVIGLLKLLGIIKQNHPKHGPEIQARQIYVQKFSKDFSLIDQDIKFGQSVRDLKQVTENILAVLKLIKKKNYSSRTFTCHHGTKLVDITVSKPYQMWRDKKGAIVIKYD